MERWIMAVLFLSLLAPGYGCVARHDHPRERAVAGDIHERIRSEQQRIDQAVSSGGLSPAAARHLQSRLNDIRDDERRFREDGRLTPPERDRLHRMLDQLSNDIAAARHR